MLEIDLVIVERFLRENIRLTYGDIAWHSQTYLLIPNGSAFPPWYSIGFTRAEKRRIIIYFKNEINVNLFSMFSNVLITKLS